MGFQRPVTRAEERVGLYVKRPSVLSDLNQLLVRLTRLELSANRFVAIVISA
jgi:hypothetical protein